MAKSTQSRATTLYQSTFNSILGPIRALSSENGLCYLNFQEASDLETTSNLFLSSFLNKYFPQAKILRESNAYLSQTQTWLEHYFAKDFNKLKLPILDLYGSSFSKQGLQRLCKLPPGKTTSYGQFASKLGNPLASRAVGRMMNQNPIALIIPCHRILGKTGQLTGYRGGLDRKRWLLEHEGYPVV